MMTWRALSTSPYAMADSPQQVHSIATSMVPSFVAGTCASQSDALAGSRARLIGLRGATHLNGRAGVIRGTDPANPHRLIFRSADGGELSVKPENCLIL